MAAVAAPAVLSTLSAEPGGITGVFDSVMMKPFYIIFTILLIIGIIVILSGKYLQGIILTLFSGGVLFLTYWLRVKNAPRKGGFYGGREDEIDDLIKLNNILNLPDVDNPDTSSLTGNVLRNKNKAISNFNLLEQSTKNNITSILNDIGNDNLTNIFNKSQ